jgi:hypothetical protein
VVEFIDDDLRGARFRRVDLSGSRWHGVMLQNVKITDTWVNNLDISGLIGTLIVNGVDVSSFVRNELDKRHPERLMLRALDVEGLRAAWTMIGEQAQATVERARALPEAALNESVDEEFSYIQTLRHLVFATDRWITGPVFGDQNHFHPLGYPHDDADAREVGVLDVDARPSLDDVLDLRRERMERVAELLRTSLHDDLRRTVASPNGGTTSVMSCIHVVLGEEWEHNRYANRDLDVLASATR